MPETSVIIPTFNRLKMLKRACKSVLDQSYTDYELIVVDDGSIDGTKEYLKSLKGKILYIYQENSGVSSARNNGIKNSRGNFIAFLDSDDEWKKDKLEIHIDYMKMNSKILISQTEEDWVRNGNVVNPKFKHIKPSGKIFYNSLELCTISPSTVMMRKEYFDLIGLFDENLPACEDYDMWIRCTSIIEVPLINKYLTTKYGGHDDQLSTHFWGMNRFRIYALQKMLSKNLSLEYKNAILKSIKVKSNILLKGAIKRKKYYFALKIVITIAFPYNSLKFFKLF